MRTAGNGRTMTDLDDETFPEQFSAESRAALAAAVDDLVAAVRAHTEHVMGLRGGSSEMPGVHEANRRVEQAIAGWNERVVDHTGTFPVALAGLDEELAEAEGEEEGEDLLEGAPLAVVSRWDLVVTDSAVLIEAGRQAHKRLRPEEQDQDAAVAVAGVGQALYALMHERGEPWYDFPGLEVVRGMRAYVQPQEPAVSFTDDDAEMEAPVAEPAGERLYLESWA